MENRMTKVITGKVRFSYANVWEPRSVNGEEEKYSVSLIIPKSDKDTIARINAAIEAAKKEGVLKFGGKVPAILKLPLRDGDAERADDENYRGSYFLNANSMAKPTIVDKDVQPIEDKALFYSGCYGRASIVFYAYSNNGTRGIACGLYNLQKLSDGEQLLGRSSAEYDFMVLKNSDMLF